ncbi:MAG TPA: transcriptional regulator, partial [Caulobacteraceae bacterium]|nr:transcriptional regulator [Caulobacteraceae bacterium]
PRPTPPLRAADHRLPPQSTRMVGRADAVDTLTTLLASRRFVSVVGPGGVGKTTVAIAVGHATLDTFGDAVYFVDLSTVCDPAMVPCTVAAVLGGVSQTQDPIASLLAFLADRRALLFLDNCEHVIDAAGLLAERLYSDAPQAHILATSREALRVEGEHVHLLSPLDYPPPSEQLTAAEALERSAVQLFMDRAFAAGHTAELTDVDAPAVAAICSRLDGIPFAIELAASRVGAYGLQSIADLLDNRFKLLWQGRRSAPPRQQSLTAMLDWSFNLLSDRDRCVLGRLSTFVGVFTLDAAQSVVSDEHMDPSEVAEAIASMVDKSLVLIAPINGVPHHRLLDTTRAYAAEKLRNSVDANIIARNHALYFEQWLLAWEQWRLRGGGKDYTPAIPHMGNVRAALEWCFGSGGDAAIAVRLAAAAMPIFFRLSLLVESRGGADYQRDSLGQASRRQKGTRARLGPTPEVTRSRRK